MVNFSPILARLQPAITRNDQCARLLQKFITERLSGRITNLSDLLPWLFHYKGEAISLTDYAPFEPIYNIDRPPRILLLSSRQVGKSLNLVIDSYMQTLWTPNWNELFVSPFYEQIRRISTDYFSAIAEQSPVRPLLYGRGCVSQVLERTLPNHSRIRFTYAHRTADRARGIHARSLKRDEVQLMSEEIRPVLEATMASSPYGIYTFDAGTPLTNSNPASREFKEASSNSHWMIPCRSCGKENIAALEYDLVGMIGPNDPDISRDRPGIICANSMCGYWLYPWDGRYVHFNPQNRSEYLGLHIPLTILPLHCCNSKKWGELHNILSDGRIPDYIKYNEYLGVPWDDGVAMLTEADLERHCILGPNKLALVAQKLNQYRGRLAIGVDWGGGGLTRESLTKVSLCGLNRNGRLDVLFGFQIIQRMTRLEEVSLVWLLVRTVKPDIFAHDDASVGDAAEEMLVGLGMPRKLIWPMRYVGETKGLIMNLSKISPNSPKAVWSVDKSRGLQHFVQAVRCGKVAFFNKTEQLHARNLLLDLTHLRAEEHVYIHSMKSETILIHKEPGQSDDFAHAIHFAANALWHANSAWPKLSTPLILRTVQDLTTYMTNLSRLVDPETLESLILRESVENDATAT